MWICSADNRPIAAVAARSSSAHIQALLREDAQHWLEGQKEAPKGCDLQAKSIKRSPHSKVEKQYRQFSRGTKKSIKDWMQEMVGKHQRTVVEKCPASEGKRNVARDATASGGKIVAMSNGLGHFGNGVKMQQNVTWVYTNSWNKINNSVSENSCPLSLIQGKTLNQGKNMEDGSNAIDQVYQTVSQ